MDKFIRTKDYICCNEQMFATGGFTGKGFENQPANYKCSICDREISFFEIVKSKYDKTGGK